MVWRVVQRGAKLNKKIRRAIWQYFYHKIKVPLDYQDSEKRTESKSALELHWS